MTTASLSSGPRNRLLGLVGFVAAVLVVAGVGSLAAVSSSQIYAGLDKPVFAPPSWLFGPVWTVLYVLIAVSGWRVWRHRGFDRSLAVYAVQLVLNMAWTPLFFAAGWYAIAAVEILVLLAAVVLTITMFARRDPKAAWLLAPYVVWVAYAAALSIAIWVLNGPT